MILERLRLEVFSEVLLTVKEAVYRKWEIEGYATYFFGNDKQRY